MIHWIDIIYYCKIWHKSNWNKWNVNLHLWLNKYIQLLALYSFSCLMHFLMSAICCKVRSWLISSPKYPTSEWNDAEDESCLNKFWYHYLNSYSTPFYGKFLRFYENEETFPVWNRIRCIHNIMQIWFHYYFWPRNENYWAQNYW